MKTVLLDTNIVSIFFKEDHPLAPLCEKAIFGYEGVITLMTRAEIQVWPIQNAWGLTRRARLEEFLNRFTTLLPDERTALRWAEIRANCRMRGRPIDQADAWIAATARQWDLPLVTDNVRDFECVDELSLVPIR